MLSAEQEFDARKQALASALHLSVVATQNGIEKPATATDVAKDAKVFLKFLSGG